MDKPGMFQITYRSKGSFFGDPQKVTIAGDSDEEAFDSYQRVLRLWTTKP